MTDTRDVFLCDGVRTPIGRYGGALAKVRTDDLAALPIRALIKRHAKLDWSALDEVVFGCANQAGEDNRNVARMALLLAGLPDSIPGITVNRLCASGLNAVGDAARAIRCGEMDFAIAGGVESMTRAPFVIGKAAAAGYFAEEIVAVEAQGGKGGKAGPIVVNKDEHPRPDTTLENLQKLKPIV